ncbi:CBO0543 family protein [Ammoniphilus sp. YIM 78166]|uniref:CBO0543 family protein n=1 Tax=Ammoniphilus sp. YIM 78166 TaxID=1644106 RepID=UPI00106F77C9|nr:CBO0543 family protein [Ammoniphilus sp. YIM 78166]
MRFSIVLFSTSWILFLIFADKKKIPLYISTCYTAVILAFITDLLMVTRPLWEYPVRVKEHLFWIEMMNAFGIYFVTTFLFLQLLPQKQTILRMTRHIFYWSTFAILIEYLALKVGFIKHQMWWNLGWSYLSDGILFTFFYAHYKWSNKYFKQS